MSTNLDQEEVMQLRRTLIASAVCAAFAGAAYAQDAKHPDPATKQGQEAATQPAPQDSAHQSTQQQGKMDEQTVRDVQQKLSDAGHDGGQVDGKWGPKTSNALKKFQQAKGMPANGELDAQTLAALGVKDNGSGSMSNQPSTQGQPSTPGAAGTPEEGSTGAAPSPNPQR
jgi:peptidoglycan hydrolase-like protein with peptidoglycan-binding domain